MTLLILSATSEKHSRPVRKAGMALSFLLMIQISLGVMSIRFGAPIGLTILHNIVAALLMMPLIAIGFYSKYAFIDEQAEALEVESSAESVADVATELEAYEEPSAESLYLRLKTQLQKTRTGLGGVLSSISLAQKALMKICWSRLNPV